MDGYEVLEELHELNEVELLQFSGLFQEESSTNVSMERRKPFRIRDIRIKKPHRLLQRELPDQQIRLPLKAREVYQVDLVVIPVSFFLKMLIQLLIEAHDELLYHADRFLNAGRADGVVIEDAVQHLREAEISVRFDLKVNVILE